MNATKYYKFQILAVLVCFEAEKARIYYKLLDF